MNDMDNNNQHPLAGLYSGEILSSTLRILSGVSERGCNSMVRGSRKFLDISVGSSTLYKS